MSLSFFRFSVGLNAKKILQPTLYYTWIFQLTIPDNPKHGQGRCTINIMHNIRGYLTAACRGRYYISGVLQKFMLSIHKCTRTRTSKSFKSHREVGRYTDRANCLVRSVVVVAVAARRVTVGARQAEVGGIPRTRSEMTAFIIQFRCHYRVYISQGFSAKSVFARSSNKHKSLNVSEIFRANELRHLRIVFKREAK